MVAVDSHCPIVDPFSGITHGHIKVKLVMGTPKHLPVSEYCYLLEVCMYNIVCMYVHCMYVCMYVMYTVCM